MVPAVQPSQKKKAKDLRPAVFIKELKKRSEPLEEEKAQRKMEDQKKKDAEIEKKKMQVAEGASEVILLEKATEKGDMRELSEALYRAKVSIEGQNQQALSAAIEKAEKTLVTLSSMSWNPNCQN